ncbi:unnamed protein product, partial [Pelagomonas calceolata]
GAHQRGGAGGRLRFIHSRVLRVSSSCNVTVRDAQSALANRSRILTVKQVSVVAAKYNPDYCFCSKSRR